MEDKYRVALYRCWKYDKDEIKKTVTRGFQSMGGIKILLGKGKKICIKPNLLMPSSPGQAITTHPIFIEAIVELIAEYTGNPEDIIIADSFSPVVPFTKKGMHRVYEEVGLKDIALRTGCRLNYSTGYSTISNPNGNFLKKIEVISPILESDIIINLPKLKTHNLTGMTGAVKNMFGVVPGFTKVGYHLRYEDMFDFAGMLMDLSDLIHPSINILDGILSIEGDGPGRSGTPKETGIIMISCDALAMDKVIGRIIGLDEDLNPFLEVKKADEGSDYGWHNIEILGEELSDMIIGDFKLPRTVGQKRLVENIFARRYIMPLVRNALNPYPYADPTRCNGCMTCQKVCPRGTIRRVGKTVIIDRSRCIRCFCCSEMCPQGAIEPKYSFIADTILNRMGFGGKKNNKKTTIRY